MNEDFVSAIRDRDIPAFFKGEGRYLKPDPDWGDHLFIRTWESLACFLKVQTEPLPLLTVYFGDFVNSLVEQRNDADATLMNVRAYYSSCNRYTFLCADGYDLLASLSAERRHKIGRLIRYLRATGGYAPPASALDKFLDDIRKNGCPWDVEAL